jgi:hypothetical protein
MKGAKAGLRAPWIRGSNPTKKQASDIAAKAVSDARPPKPGSIKYLEQRFDEAYKMLQMGYPDEETARAEHQRCVDALNIARVSRFNLAAKNKRLKAKAGW